MLLLLAACGGSTAGAGHTPSPSPSPSSSSAPSSALSPSPSTPSSASANPQAGQVTKVLVFMIENHSLDQMRQGMPFTYGLAQHYGYATDYHAIAHPSLPDYLAIAGGSTFGVTDDNPPSAHPVHGASVFDQALGMGKTAGLYAEGMPSNCATVDSNQYAVRHNPWAYFVDERAACGRYDVPLTALPGDVQGGRLPNAGMVIPDICNDAHNCGLATADNWLRDQVGAVMSGPDWASGHLAIVITADEDDYSSGNVVLTVVVHPSLHGVVVSSPLGHYSLTRFYDEALGAAPLRNAAAAPSLAAAFGLTVARP